MLDCVIRGGTVVDGTGTPGFRADVGVRDGRIVAIGDVDAPAVRTIDATDRVVCPGFVDVHTHYDAQIMWILRDPSCLHGVTTVVGGNCGFGIAPLPDDAPLAEDAVAYIGSMLAVVEGIPLASLQEGLDWRWGTFGEWLGRLDGRLGVNVGFLVGHSVLRRLVMGPAAVGTTATAEQIDQMVGLLHESLDAGGLGFSSSWAPTHVDGDAQPVPSRAASAEELVALAAATGEHPGTTLAFIPGLSPFTDLETDTMIRMSNAANRPLNWNTFRVTQDDAELAEARLAPNALAPERGARVLALNFPTLMESVLTFRNVLSLTGLPGWADTMQLPVAERMQALRDPEVRRRLESGARTAKGNLADVASWERLRVVQTFTAENADLVGRSIGDIAAARSHSPFDTLLDVTLADDLRTVFAVPPSGDDAATWALRSSFWGDPRTLIGGSDAGAHVDSLCGARYTTDLIGPSVRDRGLLPIERAVQLMTDIPARLLGLVGRGRVAEGHWADLLVLDPSRVGHGPVYTRTDLPGDASRLYSDGVGIEHVVVNGTEIVENGRITGELPGVVLRSGREVSTVLAR